MSTTSTFPWPAVYWFARLSGLAVVILLVVMMTGENGSGPSGNEWLYLAFFPVGFSIGYLAGWRWPLAGGIISLVSMVLSLLVMGESYDFSAYLTWAVLSLPGILFLAVGLAYRKRSKSAL